MAAKLREASNSISEFEFSKLLGKKKIILM